MAQDRRTRLARVALMMGNIEAALAHAEGLARHDPLMTESLVAKLRRLCPTIVRHMEDRKVARKLVAGLPEIEQITCLQMTIMNNWPTGKPEPYARLQWGFSLEAWTCGVQEVRFVKNAWDYRFIGDLRSNDEIEGRIDELRKKVNCPSEEYIELMRGAMRAHPNRLVGMFEAKGKSVGGTAFPDRQMVLIEFDPEAMTASGQIILGNRLHPLAPFSALNAGGKSLWEGKPKRVQSKMGKWRNLGVPVLASRGATDHPRFEVWSTKTSKPLNL